MKKVKYYQIERNGKKILFPERYVRKYPEIREYKKVYLPKENVDTITFIGKRYIEFVGGLPELSTKDLRKANVRKDLQRLGIIW